MYIKINMKLTYMDKHDVNLHELKGVMIIISYNVGVAVGNVQVGTNNIDMLVYVKTTKVKVPNGIHCYASINAQLRKRTDVVFSTCLII